MARTGNPRQSYILVLGAELCPVCPEALDMCRKLGSIIGMDVVYLDVEKDDRASRLYKEAVEHGYEGVPQVYLVCNGTEYFITNGVPETFTEFEELFFKLVRHYGIDIERCVR